MTTTDMMQLKINRIDRDVVRRAKIAAINRRQTLEKFVADALDRLARETERKRPEKGDK